MPKNPDRTQYPLHILHRADRGVDSTNSAYVIRILLKFLANEMKSTLVFYCFVFVPICTSYILQSVAGACSDIDCQPGHRCYPAEPQPTCLEAHNIYPNIDEKANDKTVPAIKNKKNYTT